MKRLTLVMRVPCRFEELCSAPVYLLRCVQLDAFMILRVNAGSKGRLTSQYPRVRLEVEAIVLRHLQVLRDYQPSGTVACSVSVVGTLGAVHLSTLSTRMDAMQAFRD